jgi:fumarylpyruvate hydrolase
MRQTGDLNEMIWNVPEIIAKLSQQVSLGAGSAPATSS